MVEGSIEHFQRFLGKYFVNVGWFDRSLKVASENDGMGRYQTISGFLVSIKEVWFIVTAGHILADIDEARKSGQVLTDFHIDDSWGLDATFQPQTFNFLEAKRLMVYDETQGLDYGAICLDENTKERLKANNCEAFDETTWKIQILRCENYLIVGVPAMFTKPDPLAAHLKVRKSLAMFSVIRTQNPPECMIKPIERFYGVRTGVVTSPETGELTDLDGMSGSPVIGFTETKLGLQYCLVGIQSAQDPENHRTIAANYFLPFGLTLEKMICDPSKQPI